MGDGRRRAALTAWLANDLPTRFAERILSIDHRSPSAGTS